MHSTDTHTNEQLSHTEVLQKTGVGGIDKYSTSVFLEKILRYNYIPTIGVADLQAPLNNILRSS